MKKTYQAHCIWCGHDAYGDALAGGRCPRCGAVLLLELEVEPAAAAVRERRSPESVRRDRAPRRHMVVE